MSTTTNDELRGVVREREGLSPSPERPRRRILGKAPRRRIPVFLSRNLDIDT
jgi:hypothetical protein